MDRTTAGQTREWERLVLEFQHKSDRTAAITGAVYLNTHLSRVLDCFFIPDEKVSHMLLHEENPLGTFGARIKAAYGLGLISKKEYHDLVIIWHIRNHFIRDLDEGRFDEEEIRRLCFKLKIPRDVILKKESPSPRRLFVFATAIIAQQLMWRANQAEQEKRSPREDFMMVDIDEEA